MSVPARRRQVAYGRERGLSARRACTLFSVARSALSYQGRKLAKDARVMGRMKALCDRVAAASGPPRPARCAIRPARGASSKQETPSQPSRGPKKQGRSVQAALSRAIKAMLVSGPIVPAPPDPAHRIATVDQKRPIFSQKMTGTGGCGQHMAIEDH